MLYSEIKPYLIDVNRRYGQLRWTECFPSIALHFRRPHCAVAFLECLIPRGPIYSKGLFDWEALPAPFRFESCPNNIGSTQPKLFNIDQVGWNPQRSFSFLAFPLLSLMLVIVFSGRHRHDREILPTVGTRCFLLPGNRVYWGTNDHIDMAVAGR